MSNLSAEMIRELRGRTGVGMSKCKEALVESNGDLDKAVEYLRKKGITSAVKKEGRQTKEGSIGYFETGQTISLVEVSAETDFVVKNERFKKFIDDLAEQVAETKPESVQELSAEVFTKDKSLTVDQFRNVLMQALGENIQLKRLEVIARSDQCSYGIYSHMGGKIVSIVEIEGASGEADFAKELAMHVVAEDPDYLSEAEVPADIKKREEDIARTQIKNKPEEIVKKILVGKIKAFCDQTCLVCQKFVKDPSITVGDHVDAYSNKIGKKLKIRRFWRWMVS